AVGHTADGEVGDLQTVGDGVQQAAAVRGTVKEIHRAAVGPDVEIRVHERVGAGRIVITHDAQESARGQHSALREDVLARLGGIVGQAQVGEVRGSARAVVELDPVGRDDVRAGNDFSQARVLREHFVDDEAAAA